MGSSALFLIALFLPLFLLSPSTVSAQSCSYTFSNNNNKQYAACLSLSQLSCYLHWTYNATAGTADIAFRAPASSSNWVAWALNPTGSGMAGAQSLVAYKNSSGSTTAYTSAVKSNSASTQLSQSSLSFDVTGLTAESTSSQIIIFATVKLPKNKTSVNQVWQVGPLGSDGTPSSHSQDNAHTSSMGSIDFSTGLAQSGGGGSQRDKKNVHGVLNAISWGILMPIGAIIARYLKVFKSADPAWFYLHITCQCSAYIIGVAGWATGLKLGSDSEGITYHAHRNIGITLFCFATLQVFALLLRPKKDHKHRFYWNLYHWGIGYSVLVLSIINIYKGLDILGSEDKWETAYTVVIGVLGCIALLLEVSTWIIVLRRRKDDNEHKFNNGYNGNGNGNGNVYAMRSQPSV